MAALRRDVPVQCAGVPPDGVPRGVGMNGLRRDGLGDLFPGLLDALLDSAARQSVRIGSD
jgi:hypothetical protein